MEKLIPQLRFPEFKGEWERKKFKELFEFHSTNSFSRDLLNYNEGNIYNIHYGDIHTKFKNQFSLGNENVPFINNEIALNKRNSLNFCNEGDLIIADASENYEDIGKAIELIELNNENVVAGLHTLHARPKYKLSIGYSGFYTQTNTYKNQIKTIAQGTKVLGISTKRVNEIDIYIPSLEEQTKIANFLGKVDKQIELLTTKKEKLEAYKKGIMQQLFNQELRFKKEDGTNYPDWEEKKLGEISTNISYGLNAASKSYDGLNKYIRITDIDDDTRRFIPKPLTSPDSLLDDSYLVSNQDILFARTGASVGKTYHYNKEDGKLYFAGFLIRVHINENYNSLFIFYQTLLKSYKKWLQLESTRSGQPGINAEQIKKISVKIPCLEEQTKIANFLSAIERQIEQVEKQIKKSKDFKKGLLQQMFV